MRNKFILLALMVLVSSYTGFAQAQKGLKDYYKKYFLIGVAINPRMVQEVPDAELIKTHFNSITPENAMKMGPIHPQEDKYFWKDADLIMDFVQKNGLKVRGHTLCWHNQTPNWFFKDATGKQVSREVGFPRKSGQQGKSSYPNCPWVLHNYCY